MAFDVRRLAAYAGSGGADSDGVYRFVAITEGGYDRWWGREYLSMAGAKLGRFLKNPVVKDGHNDGTDAVIGTCGLKMERDRIVTEVLFGEWERALAVKEKVDAGALRAISIEFMPRHGVEVGENQSYQMATGMVQGPCMVWDDWELHAVTIVPVPADENALRLECLSTLGVHRLSNGGPVVSRLIEARGADALGAVYLEALSSGERPVLVQAAEQEGNEEMTVELTNEEKEARRLKAVAEAIEAKKTAIMSLACGDKELESIAETCVLEDNSIEVARTKLLSAHTTRLASVGSVEPPPVKKASAAAAKAEAEKTADAKPGGLYGED